MDARDEEAQEFEKELRKLETAIAERDQEITHLNNAVAARDSSIRGLELALAKRAGQDETELLLNPQIQDMSERLKRIEAEKKGKRC